MSEPTLVHFYEQKNDWTQWVICSISPAELLVREPLIYSSSPQKRGSIAFI